MTEKKMNPDQELTQEEQQLLEKEQQFFKQQFSSLPSPKLPGSLSAQAMWEKICAGEGDHQITVDPTQMEPQVPQKPEGKVLDFPGSKKTEEKPKRNLTVHRRRWAIACTLVLVVGLSAAYWKWQRPMEQMKDMVTTKGAAEQPVEELVEEEAAAEAVEDTALSESANGQPSLKMGTPKSSAQTEKPAEEPQEKPQVAAASQPEPQAEAVLQEEQPQEESQVVTSAQQTTQEQPASARDQLRQQILNSISMAADAQEESVSLTESEEPVAETAEAAEEETQPFSIKSVMENALDSQPQTLSLKNGSLTYQPTTGEAVLSDKSGKQVSALQLEKNVMILASETSFAVLCPQETQTVTMTVYDAQDLSAPQQVQQVTHQGELFDSYQSGAGSFTMVTSIWYTREQVEAGEFLPQVNGVEIQPEQVNVISGYENGEQVNYLLTTTVSKDTQKTRIELYLD